MRNKVKSFMKYLINKKSAEGFIFSIFNYERSG